MESSKVTPKDFFLWAGAMASLYVSVFSFIALLFSYIERVFPDALNSYVDPYSGGMRAAIASLIVLFPLFLILMRLIRRDIQKDSAKKDIWVRRWALYLTVFVAGATVAIDLITLINYFLGGELTTRFVLKVAVVLLVIGAAFLHFLADIWGYWNQYPKRAQIVGWAAGLVIVLTIIAGFFIMGTPGQIRLVRFDDQKVNDLTTIQYQIISYWQDKGALPASLDAVADPLSGAQTPVDPQTGEAYVYVKTGAQTFQLCATFNAPSQETSRTVYAEPVAGPDKGVGSTLDTVWSHEAGKKCFDRTIDPDRYPVNAKPVK